MLEAVLDIVFSLVGELFMDLGWGMVSHVLQTKHRRRTALGITSRQYGADLCSDQSPVQLERLPRYRAADVAAGPRVGITVAADRLWRFWLVAEPSVSSFRPGSRRVRTSTRHTGTS